MVNVLTVDDDADNLLLVQTWLERMGHQVTTAGSATEAFTALAGSPVPDLAVVDIILPGLDGVQFLKQLRHEPGYADMPTIFLTAADLEPHPDRHDAAPATYLTKPLTRAELSAAVTAALSTKPGA